MKTPRLLRNGPVRGKNTPWQTMPAARSLRSTWMWKQSTKLTLTRPFPRPWQKSGSWPRTAIKRRMHEDSAQRRNDKADKLRNRSLALCRQEAIAMGILQTFHVFRSDLLPGDAKKNPGCDPLRPGVLARFKKNSRNQRFLLFFKTQS